MSQEGSASQNFDGVSISPKAREQLNFDLEIARKLANGETDLASLSSTPLAHKHTSQRIPTTNGTNRLMGSPTTTSPSLSSTASLGIAANATLLSALQQQQQLKENDNPNNVNRVIEENMRLLHQQQQAKKPSTPTQPMDTGDTRRSEHEERKRKKEAEAHWRRAVKRKVEEEKEKLEKEEQSNASSNQEIYALFNDLQCISKDFDIPFDCPELVVVGMQSDGKSSFIEALLGFQFNIVDTNIGTRRPLVLQMMNDPTKKNPSCRFRKEEVVAGEDPFEEKDTSIYDLAKEIQKRTNAVAGKDGDKVSASPIILRVLYAHCANLTIWDTPGFRLGGDPTLRKEIEAMVLRIAAPSHRFIICLEQSTVEWANTVSRPLIKRVDPNLARTILINTKFDNRVKELRNKEQADKYLAGEGLNGKKPFFISLPLKRDLDQKEFKQAIREAYLADVRHLLESHYDEKQFFNQVGFHKAKNSLEQLLTTKYQLALKPTLATLEELCRKTELELANISKEMQTNDTTQLKMKAAAYVQSFAMVIEKLLHGSIFGDPEKYGQTLLEEKDDSGLREWSDFPIAFDIQNQNHRVYGGAQFERLMNEFEYISHSQEFPPTTINEVAVALGVEKSHNIPVFETAASDIVQHKAKKVLHPMTDTVVKRCVYIMKRMFSIATEVMKSEFDEDFVILSLYDQFVKELQSVYDSFVDSVESSCRTKLKDDFVSLTKMIDWDLINIMSGLAFVKDYDFLNCQKEDTRKRVVSMMENKTSSLPTDGDRSRRVDEVTYRRVCDIAARLFAGVRFFFVKLVRNKLNAFFLDPMFQKLSAHIGDHFRKLSDEKYEALFNLGLEELKQKHIKLTAQLIEIKKNRDKFKEVMTKVDRINVSQRKF
eukprot:TRINITY_DN10596_c0_g1_i1.p1 TRINITY_DN10596_c0_g1~~TRINITY_DN10596_c0_g1_i1.p1  ORF type:complete len:881 (+),score=221.50 TRINITY_DN10596_c0_g1_i1:184-2826(+)